MHFSFHRCAFNCVCVFVPRTFAASYGIPIMEYKSEIENIRHEHIKCLLYYAPFTSDLSLHSIHLCKQSDKLI